MIEKSAVLEKLYFEYTHLLLGGKAVRCPYWSNEEKNLIPGPFKGKGTPKQISEATTKRALDLGLDLEKMSSAEIRSFMVREKIGVDCSGFVYHLADGLDKEKGGQGILEKVAGVNGNGPFKVNAFCLTNDRNSLPVESVAEIRIGDFIRLNAGKHIAIVLRINKDRQKTTKEVIYAHSAFFSKMTGVHTARFLIKGISAGLEKQQWFEKDRQGKDYFSVNFNRQAGDGIRRLKIWA